MERIQFGIPPLTALRAFEAAVRLGSVTAAARELHFTHGAVSRHLKVIESSLGRALFERRNRGIHPTPAARQLAGGIAEALERLERELERARVEDDQTAVVLSCEPTLLMRWLIPRLPALSQTAPDVSCRLLAAGGPVAFRRDGVDIALRRDDFRVERGLHTAALMAEQAGPVCRPEIAARLRTPADLAGFTLLHTATRPRAWDAWAEATDTELPAAHHEHLEHFYLTLQAASAGLGVAIASRAMALDDLGGGQLAAPFGFAPDGSRYVLLSPTAFEDEPAHGAVLDWLRAAIRTDGLAPPG